MSTSDHRGAAARGALIQIEHVSRTYGRSGRFGGRVVHALDDITLDVRRGERLGVVGESGSGKSTLIRLLAGLDQPTSGTVSYDGQLVSGRKEKQLGFLRQDLQVVFQDPMGSLDPRMKVRQIIAEPLLAGRHDDPVARITELLDAVGLPATAADRYPHEFSGGQRQRISIARALAPRPTVLVADEPVSALDVSVRAQILNLLADLVDELNLTMIFVSHDLSVVRRVCDRVAVLQGGHLVEVGSTEQIYCGNAQPYTSELIEASPSLAALLHPSEPSHNDGARP